ncbi:hypothetical protein [Streptomyces umbrinus]
MAVERLRAGDVPAGWLLAPDEAQELGGFAHMRSYLTWPAGIAKCGWSWA